jgi:hypothetical protein
MQRWEALSTRVQGAVAYPVFFVVLLFLNLGVFNQPVGRSILYGFIESAPLTALLLVATTNERRKRGLDKPGDRRDER